MSDIHEGNKQNQTLQQIINYRQNPIRWIKDNVMIRNQAKGSVKFNMYDFQEKVINLFLLNHFVITLKSIVIPFSVYLRLTLLFVLVKLS